MLALRWWSSTLPRRSRSARRWSTWSTLLRPWWRSAPRSSWSCRASWRAPLSWWSRGGCRRGLDLLLGELVGHCDDDVLVAVEERGGVLRPPDRAEVTSALLLEPWGRRLGDRVARAEGHVESALVAALAGQVTLLPRAGQGVDFALDRERPGLGHIRRLQLVPVRVDPQLHRPHVEGAQIGVLLRGEYLLPVDVHPDVVVGRRHVQVGVPRVRDARSLELGLVDVPRVGDVDAVRVADAHDGVAAGQGAQSVDRQLVELGRGSGTGEPGVRGQQHQCRSHDDAEVPDDVALRPAIACEHPNAPVGSLLVSLGPGSLWLPAGAATSSAGRINTSPVRRAGGLAALSS